MKKTAYYGFTGIIDPLSAQRIASAFNQAVNEKCDEFYFCLNSLGGSVSDGIFLYNHIMGLPVKTIIHNTSDVMSIATVIYVAAAERYCSKHGKFMLHPTEMPAIHNSMRAEQLQSALDAALTSDQRTEDILRERARIPDPILDARRFKEVFIDADKAVEFGLAHKVVEFSLPDGHEIIQI